MTGSVFCCFPSGTRIWNLRFRSTEEEKGVTMRKEDETDVVVFMCTHVCVCTTL